MLFGEREQATVGTAACNEFVHCTEPCSVALGHRVSDFGEGDALWRADHSYPGVTTLTRLGHDAIDQKDIGAARHDLCRRALSS